MQNGLQLNLEKSEALMIGTANQLHTISSTVTSVGCDDLQGLYNHDTNVTQSASHVAPACMDITPVGRSAAHQAFHQNRVCKARFPTLCADCLELTTEIDHQLRLIASV